MKPIILFKSKPHHLVDLHSHDFGHRSTGEGHLDKTRCHRGEDDKGTGNLSGIVRPLIGVDKSGDGTFFHGQHKATSVAMTLELLDRDIKVDVAIVVDMRHIYHQAVTLIEGILGGNLPLFGEQRPQRLRLVSFDNGHSDGSQDGVSGESVAMQVVGQIDTPCLVDTVAESIPREQRISTQDILSRHLDNEVVETVAVVGTDIDNMDGPLGKVVETRLEDKCRRPKVEGIDARGNIHYIDLVEIGIDPAFHLASEAVLVSPIGNEGDNLRSHCRCDV